MTSSIILEKSLEKSLDEQLKEILIQRRKSKRKSELDKLTEIPKMFDQCDFNKGECDVEMFIFMLKNEMKECYKSIFIGDEKYCEFFIHSNDYIRGRMFSEFQTIYTLEDFLNKEMFNNLEDIYKLPNYKISFDPYKYFRPSGGEHYYFLIQFCKENMKLFNIAYSTGQSHFIYYYLDGDNEESPLKTIVNRFSMKYESDSDSDSE